MQIQKTDNWWEWFNSPYYHVLYHDRDEQEAAYFMQNLIAYLQIPSGASILDVACGKGRHAIFLNKSGSQVEGIDLSAQNIQEAKKFENDQLKFFIHDMRKVFKPNSFDYAVNLFTSFGFFESEEENQQAISAIAEALKEGGIFVLDFLNPYRVIHHLVKEEVKHVNGIEFHLNRKFDGEYIMKDIQFIAEGYSYNFQEKVKAIRRLSFLTYFRNANLMLLDTFGNYGLQTYKPETSKRMIFIVKKL